MTYTERQSCIHTLNTLKKYAIDKIDIENCQKLIFLLDGGIDEIYMKHYKQGLSDAVEKPEFVFDPD